MTERLYSTENVAHMTNSGIQVVRTMLVSGKAPAHAYQTISNTGRVQRLWDQAGLEKWYQLISEREEKRREPRPERSPSPFGIRQGKAFSDHNAVNEVGSVTVTWRLWYHVDMNVPSRTVWWFSTPEGWFSSGDDGRTWVKLDIGDGMRRPSRLRYHPVNDPRRVRDGRQGTAAYNGAMGLQRRIEERRPPG